MAMPNFGHFSNPNPKCMVCGEQDALVDMTCKDCFRKQQEKKSIKERLLDLEISTRLSHHHSHIDNMRF